MSATSRELVEQTLAFASPKRAPRQLWVLPWAEIHHPRDLEKIRECCPDDIEHAPVLLHEQPSCQGDPYAIGEYVDEWGCKFQNAQEGIIGEVKEPMIADWEVDISRIHIPCELLTIDSGEIDRHCELSQRFILAGCCPRPFERLQFLRGTAEILLDLLEMPDALKGFLEELHRFNCQLLESWCKTAVNGVFFMDDWGSQHSLLISPDMWREIFKPMYRDFIQIAHSAGKSAFMHSDGYIIDIIPDLIELGLDAINSQIFCMGVDALAPFAGQITFWGEIDRQHILPKGKKDDVKKAVASVHRALWRNGGCIAQCEFGPGAASKNIMETFVSWDALTAREKQSKCTNSSQ